MKSNAFGLDIGTATIKVVWLEKDKNKLTLLSSLSCQTPPKGMLSESMFDQEEMARVIRQLVTDANISINDAHIALSDNQVYTKVIDMPILADNELSSAIHWEAEQYIPVQLSTITLRWKVLRKQQNQINPTMQVLLIGAPQTTITKYQKVLEMAGITPLSVETETLSILRAIGLNQNSQTVLIMNIGSLSTSLAIVQKGIIIFAYSVPLGGTAISRAIATDFGFSIEQAEEYKRTYGISDNNLGGKISKAIEPILVSLATEVKKALIFYEEKYKKETAITQILLAGGTAKLPGIGIFFVKKFGIETVIVNPWEIMSIQGVSQEVHDTSSEYAVAVGLALKEYE